MTAVVPQSVPCLYVSYYTRCTRGQPPMGKRCNAVLCTGAFCTPPKGGGRSPNPFVAAATVHRVMYMTDTWSPLASKTPAGRQHWWPDHQCPYYPAGDNRHPCVASAVIAGRTTDCSAVMRACKRKPWPLLGRPGVAHQGRGLIRAQASTSTIGALHRAAAAKVSKRCIHLPPGAPSPHWGRPQ
jgi:hypothetical protein